VKEAEIFCVRKMSSRFRVGIATYEEVIDTLKDPERLLIDVREEQEVNVSGQIPTSINIPGKFY
jgi:3-mercaptopyruvate sulfurtransferase SseA